MTQTPGETPGCGSHPRRLNSHIIGEGAPLADRRRRRLLAELAHGPQTVSVLADVLGLKMSAMSKHITVLEAAGLILKTRRGRMIVCHLNFDVWRVVAAYIAMHAKFWSGRLDELETYLREAGAQ